MAEKIAEDLAEGDRILFDIGELGPPQFTVVSRHVFPEGGVDQVAVFAVDENDAPRLIAANYGQTFEVPGW